MNAETAPLTDVFTPQARSDPFPFYRRMRESGGVHATGMGTYVVSRYADCMTILGDPAWGRGYSQGLDPFRPGVDPAELPGSFLLMDPPDHTRLRSLVSTAFTTRRVAALRPRVTAIVEGLLDAAVAAGEVDLVAALAYPLTITTICEMLGVPAPDRGLFGEWTSAISRGLDPDGLLSAAEVAARDAAVRAFADYFARLLAQRRREPREDMLSHLAAVEDRGDVLSSKELFDVCLLLLVGGHETTMNLISGAVLALWRHPDQLALLRDQPHLAPRAVEEFLRFDTPVPFPQRTALRDAVVAGRSFPRGSGVHILVGSANRDPAAFLDPDRLDITRFGGPVPAPRHLAFSHGSHFCLGSPLARLEAEVALAALVRRAPALAVLDDDPPYRPSVSMRGLAELPVRLR